MPGNVRADMVSGRSLIPATGTEPDGLQNLWGRPLGLPEIAAEVIQTPAVGTGPHREHFWHRITIATIAEKLSQREERLSLQALPFSVKTVFEIPGWLRRAGLALGHRQGIAGLRGEFVDECQVPVLPVRRR